MEPFKNLLNPRLVRAAGEHLQSAWPAFDKAAFVRRANRGLEALELKARAMQIADALEATLPPRFAAACDLIEAALAVIGDVPSEPGIEDRRAIRSDARLHFFRRPIGKGRKHEAEAAHEGIAAGDDVIDVAAFHGGSPLSLAGFKIEGGKARHRAFGK